ncbi:MAG: LAGLIDADG family homing endonuclease [Candidatus Woesearchaeota archaeon]
MDVSEQIKKFEQFIEQNYHLQLIEAVSAGHNFLVIDFARLAKFNPELADLLLDQPEELIKAFEIAIKNTEEVPDHITRFNIRVTNTPNSQEIKIRDIRSKHIDKLICIDGIVRQKTDVRPQVITAKFECPSCGNVMPVIQIEAKFKEPTRCGCGRKGKFRLLSKELVDAQKLVLEEIPEDLEDGGQPKRIDVFLKNDLVSPLSDKKTNPGTKIRIVGQVKEIPIPAKDGGNLVRFDLIIDTNMVIALEESFGDITITPEEENKIIELSKDPKILSKLVNSMAPSIYGHDKVKEAIILQFLGGVKKIRTDGVTTRGDMHILLVGDPGAGKCLHGDSKIVLSDGSIVKIKELVEHNLGEKIEDDGYKATDPFNVISFDTHAQASDNTSRVVWKRKERRLLQVRTKTGNKILVTKNHPFFTTDDGLIFSKSANELRKGDFIASPSIIRTYGKLQPTPTDFLISKSRNRVNINVPPFIDLEFARLLGYLVGDGWVKLKDKGAFTSFTNNDPDMLSDFKRILSEKFGANVTVRKVHKSNKSKEIYTTSIELTRLLEKTDENLLSRSAAKRIPRIVLKSPDAILRDFLRSLFDCEAHIRSGRRQIEISSKSKDLIDDIKIALLRFGIISSISEKIKWASNTTSKTKRKYHELRISGVDVLKYHKNVGFFSTKKKNQLDMIAGLKKTLNTNVRVVPNMRRLLKTIRSSNHLSQNDMGISRSSYQHYEMGDRNPSVDKLRQIVNHLTRKGLDTPLLSFLRCVANNDVFWDKIDGVEEIDNDGEYVYDIQVDIAHNFVSNAMIVHNSQLLKRGQLIAPKSRFVSGKGASGAGLTAAVVKDEFLRGWALEAGALVLANKGFCMIDEMDKMTKEDRSAMHEALEQQCFHHDTTITFADGHEMKIGEFAEGIIEKFPERVIRGHKCLIVPTRDLDIEVMTTDWEKISKTKVDRVSKHIAEESFVKIRLRNGREIIVTPEHPVFVIEDGKITTKRADSLDGDETVPIPLNMPIRGADQEFSDSELFNPRAINHIRIPAENGPEIYKIAGYLLSEGSKELNRGKLIGVNFTNKDTRLLDDLEKCMLKEFGIKAYRQARIDDHDIRWMSRFISRELSEFFSKNLPEILEKADNKKIPQLLMKGKAENIALMLSCMFEGDGHVSKKERTIRIGFASNSKRMCEQVQDLLLRFSIRSNLTEHKESYKVSVTGYENLARFHENIRFVTDEKNSIVVEYLRDKRPIRSIKDNVPNIGKHVISLLDKYKVKRVGRYDVYRMRYEYLRKGVSISRRHLKDCVKALDAVIVPEDTEYVHFLRGLAFGDIGFEKIRSVEIVENKDQKWSYDLTIEPNHAFISQNMVLHNTVTISKANIQATLRCETTVLAAANPKWGRFDPYEILGKQIDLPPALISRFDLIFPIRDIPNKEQDERLASFVLNLHQTSDAGHCDLDTDTLKKYIAYARRTCVPKLTDAALEEIKRYYVHMRNSGGDEGGIKAIPITARQLEALVRLSEASARTRLAEKVLRKDAIKAIELLHYCMSQIGVDPDTGKIDVDILTTGISSSSRNNIVIIKEAINELENKIGKTIPIEDIVKQAQEKGVSADKSEEVIEKLKRAGDIFEPKRGFIQKI